MNRFVSYGNACTDCGVEDRQIEPRSGRRFGEMVALIPSVETCRPGALADFINKRERTTCFLRCGSLTASDGGYVAVHIQPDRFHVLRNRVRPRKYETARRAIQQL